MGNFRLFVLNRPPRSLGTALARLQAEHEMQESKIMPFIEELLKKYPTMRKKGYAYPGSSIDRLFQSSYLYADEQSTVVLGGREVVVSMLLRHGADPNARSRDGQLPLYLAVDEGSKALVELLLKAGCDALSRDRYGRTFWMTAAVRGKGGATATLLKSPDINRDATDVYGRSAFTEARRTKNFHILNLLSQDSKEIDTINTHDAIIDESMRL